MKLLYKTLQYICVQIIKKWNGLKPEEEGKMDDFTGVGSHCFESQIYDLRLTRV